MSEMKISVDVETESLKFDHKEAETPQRGSKGGLKWRIDVSLAEAGPSPSLTIISEAPECVTRAPASVVTRPRVSRVDLSSSGAQTAIRKLSSTSELIERMGRGRKVITERLRRCSNHLNVSTSGVPPRRVACFHRKIWIAHDTKWHTAGSLRSKSLSKNINTFSGI